MTVSMERPTNGVSRSNVVKFRPSASTTSATVQGWKQIAAELDRSVRTVQRWERTLSLPVHKLGNGPGSPVFAFKDELHAWLRHKADNGLSVETDTPSKPAPLGQDAKHFQPGRTAQEAGRKPVATGDKARSMHSSR